MSESMGKYLYGIIRCSQPHQFVTPSMGEQSSIVHTLSFRDIAAVVSDSPMIEYERTRRAMMTHTEVLEHVMKEFTVLPVRFGTVSPGEDAVIEQVLERRYVELCDLLNAMDGHVELGLKAFWYEEGIFREIVEENQDIRRLRDSMVGKSPEATYYDRVRLGEMVETAMQRKRDLDADKILTTLRPLTEKTRVNKVLTDRMILNAAFLVNRAHETVFDQTVEQLEREMQNRLMFKYVGPVPLYNFVTIIVAWD